MFRAVEDTQPESWSLERQSQFIRSSVLQHELTQTLMGGPYGIKWAVMLLVRAYWSLKQLNGRHRPDYAARNRINVADALSIVRDDVSWLTAEIQRSRETLARAHAVAQTRRYTVIEPQSPEILRAEPAEEVEPLVGSSSSRGSGQLMGLTISLRRIPPRRRHHGRSSKKKARQLHVGM